MLVSFAEGAVVRAAGVLAIAALVVSGCGRSDERASSSSAPSSSSVSASAGGGASALDDLGLVGGQPITDVPSGLRPDAPTAIPAVTNTDDGEIDRLAAMAMADIEEFWSGAYGPPLTGKFTPVAGLFSWDSTAGPSKAKFCGQPTEDYINARFCDSRNDGNCTTAGACTPSYDTIGWDRGSLLPQLREKFGDNAVSEVIAHETGHAIQRVMSDLKPYRSIIAEQQADCFAGMYARWVTEGKSPRFTLNTGEGLNKVLASVLGGSDAVETEEDRKQSLGVGEHGSGFERVSAFEMGFDTGTAACTGIDGAEIAARRGNLPVALQSGESGTNPVTEESVKVLVAALNTVFAPASPPALSFTTGSCADATSSPPASYCPATNTLSVDLPALAALSTDKREPSLPQFGDYTAYSMVVSRYMLAVQHQLTDAPALDTEQAGLRTACLTGVATAKMSSPVTAMGQTIKLTAGDLDEAVAGSLDNGLIAADVNGKAPLKGFARVAALRIGVLGDQDTCLKKFA